MDVCDDVKACDNLQHFKKSEAINPSTPECNRCPEDISNWEQNAVCDFEEMSSCSCTYEEKSFCFLECNPSGTWTLVCGRGPDVPVGFNGVPPPVNLESFCSLDLITSEDHFSISKCVDICKAAECCKDKTCAEEVSFCSSYISCYNVWEVDELMNKDSEAEFGT